jgi:hypothetical protein
MIKPIHDFLGLPVGYGLIPICIKSSNNMPMVNGGENHGKNGWRKSPIGDSASAIRAIVGAPALFSQGSR